MKFLYGKQDWKTLERGEENCYLMTNGLGGFSSLTMTGSCSRGDHAVLMACIQPPNHRYNMIHRLEERLCLGGERIHISSQSFEGGREPGEKEDGWRYQTGFSFEDYPQWTYLVKGVEVVKNIVLAVGENTVGISYEIHNRSAQAVSLEVLPYLQFAPKGLSPAPDQDFSMEKGVIRSRGLSLYFETNGEVREIFGESPEEASREKCPEFHDDLYYAYDACDGRAERGAAVVNHQISFSVLPGESGKLCMVYGMKQELPSVDDIIRGVVRDRKSLGEKAGFADETARALALAASQFVSQRASTKGKTILAGFPFFEDWGRDTMIALPGCCLATRQYEAARSILRTFMAYCKKGLMPNLFPEGGREPGYNTVDAALLFILAVYEYYRKSGDKEFVREAYPVMEEIVHWYREGTDFGIKMDEDGLIMAGRDYDQVTWMDVRVGEILPTPRHGKPVEINAYWYNALRIMQELSALVDVCREKPWGKDLFEDGRDYGQLADQVKESFNEKFWNEQAGCLKDVISGTKADRQIRCNQIWAVSQPFSILPPEREKMVVDAVFCKLYTPVGLRTLDPLDKEFHPSYGGPQLERDLAYHQGTVWVFPLGGYYLADLKVHGYSQEAKERVRRQLSQITAALREGCIGQLPEIYDGENPTSSRGCFAQAWSVGEILRVYDAIRS